MVSITSQNQDEDEGSLGRQIITSERGKEKTAGILTSSSKQVARNHPVRVVVGVSEFATIAERRTARSASGRPPRSRIYSRVYAGCRASLHWTKSTDRMSRRGGGRFGGLGTVVPTSSGGLCRRIAAGSTGLGGRTVEGTQRRKCYAKGSVNKSAETAVPRY